MGVHPGSAFRFEKRRSKAVLGLATGEMVSGHFFTGTASVHHSGQERIGDLLNAEAGFFPFEVPAEDGPRMTLYNRAHIVTVTVSSDEPSQELGYNVATRKAVSMLLSTGQRLAGTIRVYLPEGHNRLSDWARNRDQFHYVETDGFALLVNGAHIVEVAEVLES
jgi:hypothetical protein